MMTYQRPQSLKEALSILQQFPEETRPLAGGTDLLVRWNKGAIDPPRRVLDLKGIDALTGIEQEGDRIRIGALTLMCEIAGNDLLREHAPALAAAGDRVACRQIRNRATLGGNLSNASPAADTAIPLILYDAELELAHIKSNGIETREVSINDFFEGPGATVLEPGELLTQVRLRPLKPRSYSAWNKFGTRPAMEIAVASVGAAMELDGGVVRHARVGYGSVAPVPLRGRGAEEKLLNRPLTDEAIEECVAAAREEIAPISDVRAGADYRREVTGVMLRRLLQGGKDR